MSDLLHFSSKNFSLIPYRRRTNIAYYSPHTLLSRVCLSTTPSKYFTLWILRRFLRNAEEFWMVTSLLFSPILKCRNVLWSVLSTIIFFTLSLLKTPEASGKTLDSSRRVCLSLKRNEDSPLHLYFSYISTKLRNTRVIFISLTRHYTSPKMKCLEDTMSPIETLKGSSGRALEPFEVLRETNF